jgi:PleD family two-component response regulator
MSDRSQLLAVPREPVPKAKILIVDDTEPNRVAFKSILERPRHEIHEAADGIDALQHLIDNDYAVILLDIRMPRMGGLETAANIRARKRSRLTPIIFLSAYESTPVEVSKAYLVGGVIDYLFSPVDPDMLRSKVSFLVDLQLRTMEVERGLKELREQSRAQEARIQELQKLLPNLTLSPDPKD